MNLFTKSPEWLRSVLGLQEPENVHHLETGAIIGTVDIASPGIRDVEAVIIHFENTQVGTGAVADWLLFPDGVMALVPGSLAAQVFTHAFVGYISLVNQGGTAQTASALMWGGKAGAVDTNIKLSKSLTLAGNNVLTHAEVTGTPRPIVIPPGFKLQVSSTTTAGQQITCQVLGYRVPARVLRDLF